MEWLNYHHLHYFWVVAREGGLVQAGRVLRLSHPTLSAQVHALEDRMGEKLFARVGRKLELTEMGHVVYRYAEEIFSLGREMVDVVEGRASGRPIRLDVGVADAVPKLIVRCLLEPALRMKEPVRIVCSEHSHEQLLAELALHTLDIVLSDAPVSPGSAVRAFSHLLGETDVTFFGTPALRQKHRGRFPKMLDDAPVLLPLANLTSRRALDEWFERHDVKPRVIAELEDSALLEALGADGLGFFPAPTAIAQDVSKQYAVRAVGRANEVQQRFYAISAERKLKNPAVVAISNAARHALFKRR